VPFELSQAIRTVEDRARSVLSPQQMRAAQEHVATAKNRILHDEQSREHARNDRQANKLMQDLTRGMLGRGDGLTREQFAQVQKGEKKLKFKSGQEYFDPKVADKVIRERTKRLDPAGKGFGFKEWQRRLDQLVDAGEGKFAELAKEYKGSPDELRKAVDAWGTDRYGFEMRMRNASKTPPKDESVRVTDDDHRRATVIGAYLDHTDAEDDQQTDMLFNGISNESLNDDGMRGDIARAFDQVEERDDAHAE
jgi:hypothetical protein